MPCISLARRILFAGLLPAFLGLPGGPAAANGWEHAAVPFRALIEALEFEDPAIRARAARSLGLRGQREAVAPLIALLAKPEAAPSVRSAAYTALGRLGDRRARPVLESCLDEESREELRGDCAAALGSLGDPAALPRLLAALDGDPAFLVRSRTVEALGHFPQYAAVAALIGLLAPEANRSLRRRAIAALAVSRPAAATQPLLRLLAESRSAEERFAVVDTLARLAPKEAVAPLQALLAATQDPLRRTRVVIALGAIRDGSAAPSLVESLGDPVPAVRFFAIKGLQDIGDTAAAPAILDLYRDISAGLAARPPGELLADAAATVVDLSLQHAALQALAELDAPLALPAFLEAALPLDLPRTSAAGLAVAEAVYQRRRAALRGLGYTASRPAAELLGGPAGLGDGDFRLRAVALRSLAVLGYDDAAAAILPALEDTAAEVRWSAAAALGRLGDGRAVQPLIRRLADGTAEVRKQAALGLGYLGAREARPGLMRLRHDERDAGVREAAGFALKLLDQAD